MLNDHRIERIECFTAQRSYPRPVTRNARGNHHGQHTRVPVRVVHTDQGATGWGFCHAQPDLIASLIGKNLAELIDLDTGTAPAAVALDSALHDLAGRIVGQPVWQMLGAAGSREVPVYTGAIYFDDLEPLDDPPGVDGLLAACAHDAALGHAHFKLKIGRGAKVLDRAAGDVRDIEVTRAVRAAYPDAKILVDANDGYDPDGFCRYLEAVADCNLFWVEEPFVETAAGLRQLREVIQRRCPGTLVADGESRNGREPAAGGHLGKWERAQVDELLGFAREDLLDVLLMDVGAMGFTAWRTLMPELKAAGVYGSPHAWSEPFKTYYAAQLGAGLGNVNIVEGVPGTVTGVDDGGYVLKDGVLTLPDAPGFGMELDTSALEPA